MPAGRPPKPTALHILEGTLREDRHADRKREPRGAGPPVKPPTLRGEASAHWDAQVVEWIKERRVTASHQAALEQMCEWWAEWRRLGGGTDEIKAPGRIYAMGAAFKNWFSLAKEFGATPVSQARIAADVSTPDDIAAKYGFG